MMTKKKKKKINLRRISKNIPEAIASVHVYIHMYLRIYKHATARFISLKLVL